MNQRKNKRYKVHFTVLTIKCWIFSFRKFSYSSLRYSCLQSVAAQKRKRSKRASRNREIIMESCAKPKQRGRQRAQSRQPQSQRRGTPGADVQAMLVMTPSKTALQNAPKEEVKKTSQEVASAEKVGSAKEEKKKKEDDDPEATAQHLTRCRDYTPAILKQYDHLFDLL
ncbi:unnamed protein product [Caenorhabditis auriculariae]|uniref:Uncharacterized protein n=1 Tax=Caenorhabditis auriculariae TaxID=2777116 RepID=A0A8S1HYF1_9PELO|nr:unnamed protein product [Caenorhabditis auriculariae]